MGPSRNNISLVLGIILLIAVDAGYSVLGFASSVTRKHSPRIPSTALPVATIDAAELFDGSFVFGGIDREYRQAESSIAEATLGNVGGAQEAALASANRAIETVSSSSLAWAAIGAFLSLSAALSTRRAVASPLRFFTSISSWYLTRLEVAPLITKCITGGIIALVGDYGAQWFEYKQQMKRKQSKSSAVISSSDAALTLRAGAGSAVARRLSKPSFSIHGTYDLRRGVARFLECLLVSGPLLHYGYDLFESILPVAADGASGARRSLTALMHVFADSLFLDGIFVATGIIATGVLEGNSFRRHVLPNLRNVYLPTLKASVMTSSALMPLQFLSFRFLPLQLRVLSVNAVDLIWTGVVSHASHSGGDIEGSH